MAEPLYFKKQPEGHFTVFWHDKDAGCVVPASNSFGTIYFAQPDGLKSGGQGFSDFDRALGYLAGIADERRHQRLEKERKAEIRKRKKEKPVYTPKVFTPANEVDVEKLRFLPRPDVEKKVGIIECNGAEAAILIDALVQAEIPFTIKKKEEKP